MANIKNDPAVQELLKKESDKASKAAFKLAKNTVTAELNEEIASAKEGGAKDVAKILVALKKNLSDLLSSSTTV